MKCWGHNAYGQLGNGDGADQNTPQPVATSEAVTVRLYIAETEAGGYREPGPLVPEITTYIPTPLDVSTKPTVLGTNLLLAAVMMLPFAVAAELFTRTLGEHEGELRKKFRPMEWISRLQKRLEETAGAKIAQRPVARDALKLTGVILFYGLVFSLLDRTWNPFSLQGLILFLSMTIAYGVVGIADDIIQWRAIRKWGLTADLTLRPTNLLLAMASTTTSRLLSMVPGLMFGTPEAADSILRLMSFAEGMNDVAGQLPPQVKELGSQLIGKVMGDGKKDQPMTLEQAAGLLPQLMSLVDRTLDVNKLKGKTVNQVLGQLEDKAAEADRPLVAQARTMLVLLPFVADSDFESMYLRYVAAK
jgi:hypothetical protein